MNIMIFFFLISLAHLSQGSKFDFQKFLRRALDKDFAMVVGISLWIWIFSTFFLFFNAHKFYNYLWLPFIPLVMVLAVGTKLQVIITNMCLVSRNESVVVRGILLVKPSDHFFWFGRPHLLLHIIHLILFQNSFQLAFFTWTWCKFGLRSCFHRETEDIIIRIALSVLVQLLIGYVILPLYGLVKQMGSTMNKMVFTERVSMGLKNWHALAKRKLGTDRPTPTGSPRPAGQSPSQAMETLLTNTHELERTDMEHPETDVGSMAIEIMEVERTKPSSSTKGCGGEISLRW
ncbi:MLO-like protein [Magnolia sinica]|uniref:MLO-like protein n=1 Tax=Magnolia sinica TaxID=86752 RepID=UPI0026584C34|nr:MLO-like protein [Magnolia sinica]